MQTLPPAILAHVQARKPIDAQVLVWTAPRNRTTGATEELALWTGGIDRDFVIEGDTRTYYGAGSILSVAPIVSGTGTEIRMQRMSLAAITPEVEQLMRGYEPRLAAVEIHRAVFDPDTRELLGIMRLFKGWIDTAPIKRPEDGGPATVEVTLASTARALTRTLTAKKSDASQRRRSGDRFRRYADVSGSVPVNWGEAG